MRKNYFLSLLLLMIAFWKVEAREREISKESVTTSIPANPPLPKPTEFQANPIPGIGTKLNLIWRDNSTGETSFQVAISIDGVNFSSNTFGPNVGDYVFAQLPDLLPKTKYWLAVRAIKDGDGATDFTSCSGSPTIASLGQDDANLYSCWTDIITVTTNPNIPFAPTGVGVMDGWTQTSATLVFNDVSTDEDSFLVRRSVNGGPFLDLMWVPTNSSTGTGQVQFTDNSLIANNMYQYHILSGNAAGISTTAGISPIFFSLPNPPAAPTDLISPWQTLNKIRLEFYDRSDNEDNFEIWRSADGVNYGPLTTTWFANINFFEDDNVSEGQTFYYKVRAKNKGGFSDFSNPVKATAKKRTPPPAPYALQAKSISPTEVDLNWSNPLFGEYDIPVSIEIYRSSVSATDGFVQVTKPSIEPQLFTFSDTALTPKTKYWYKIRAVNYQGPSEYSNIAVVTTLGPPLAPTELAAVSTKDSLGNDVLVAHWTDNSDDEEHFILERATSADFTQNLLTSTFFEDYTAATSLPFEEGVTYFYRIKATNKYGASAYSETATITAPYTVVPNKPFGLKATAAATSVSLKWGDDSNKEESFVIERSTNGTAFTSIGTTGRNVVTFKDSTATASTKYWYRVKAVNPQGSSGYSEVVAVTTLAGTSAIAAAADFITTENWQVYPNPTADGVKVTLPESMQNKVAFLTVIDRMNREIIRTKIDANQGEYNLDLRNFTEGTYTISIRTADKQISKRVYKY